VRVNASDSSGSVHFHALRFSDAGVYDLNFALGRGPKAAPTSASSRGGGGRRGGANPAGVAAVRVRVAAHNDDSLGPLGRCGQALYAVLRSLPRAHGPAFSLSSSGGSALADGFGGGGGKLGADDAFAWLPAPLGLWAPLPSLDHLGSSSSSSSGSSSSSSAGAEEEGIGGGGNGCGALLSEAGFRATLAWGGGVWLRYKPAAVALDTGFGLPTASMPPLARLGLVTASVSASSSRRPSERAVRRAYYQASLLWHPDRWAGYPGAFQRRAMDCFELVADAYRLLSEPPDTNDSPAEKSGEKGGGGGKAAAVASIPIVLGM
jgi:hypothetical protein